MPSLCGPDHPKPSGLGSGPGTAEAASGAQNLVTLLLGQIAVTGWLKDKR